MGMGNLGSITNLASAEQARIDQKKKEEADRKAAIEAVGPKAEEYLPYWSNAMQGSYGNYMDTLGEGNELPDLTQIFKESGGVAYKAAPTVNANEWYNKYTAGPYKSFDYTFGNDYGPITNTAYDYSTPDIEQVQDISGVPADVWKQISAGEEEAARQGFKGQRAELARRMAAGGGARGGLSAALNARLGSEEEGAVAKARQQAAIQRALQEVGIAQGTQALKATRAIQQSAQLTQAEELQAQELARKQGIDIEDARYRVGLKKEREMAQSTEGKYSYEKGEETAKYKTGLDVANEEARNAEREKAYKSKYGLAQDVTGLELTKHQQEQQDLAARRQAALSGAQLAQGGFSQTGSYDIQKGEDRNSPEYVAGAQIANEQAKTELPKTELPKVSFPSTFKKETTATQV